MTSSNDDTHQHLPRVICIMGPTASGKTKLAIDAAKALNGEVISVDSALIYKDMDIGTAKPSLAEQDGVPHHLIDIVSPEQSYSVADFLRDAQSAIESVLKKDKVPILAGGTMMYFNALINGLNELPESDAAVREQVQKEIEQNGLQVAHNELAKIDAKSAARIHANDSQRITRALEVYLSSGKTMTEWQNQEKQTLPYQFQQFSIMPQQRSELHANIALRFELMLEQGFVDEVKSLLAKYTLHPDLPSLRSVGYRQIWQYLQGELSLPEATERGIIATRQLAKRQITWLRSWDSLCRLNSSDITNINKLVQKLSAT